MEHCKSCRNLNPDLAATGLGHLGHFLDILGVKLLSVKRLVSRRPWLLDPAEMAWNAVTVTVKTSP